MLETKKPREQSGRDSFSRYRAQVRSAAIASLSILEGDDVDRVYCDLHDDFVVRKKNSSGYSYVFYQVKTMGKKNHNWTLNELFGLRGTLKDQNQQSTDKIKNSFIGKLLLHTVVFDQYCNSVVFQTNIHNANDVENLLTDIEDGEFQNKFSEVLINRFNNCFPDEIVTELSPDEIKERLSKLKFETDVQYLKNGDDNFEPLARDKIYKFSEVDLLHTESKEILMKLLELVERKSSGVIAELTSESIEEFAGISIDDLLSILSISKDAYDNLLKGGDNKAIKSASIIQRTLTTAGGSEEVEYCSRCKTNWDLWLRKNRHVILEFELQSITSQIKQLLNDLTQGGNSINLVKLSKPIKDLVRELTEEDQIYDLNHELILGGIFAELVKGKS
ncbi:DUF4297 domain-containing protein [Colwellia sp. MSW7]|uniref:DUF4297 domain-containing protein n=1 Tax=Colwellia maritima TaxID=2912588 RepID=A0ABS9X294_9GAMM|nr:DUF4297 domain-containing protein [Colwellia maritima]